MRMSLLGSTRCSGSQVCKTSDFLTFLSQENESRISGLKWPIQMTVTYDSNTRSTQPSILCGQVTSVSAFKVIYEMEMVGVNSSSLQADTDQVGWHAVRVSNCLALFYVNEVNWVNSCNGCAIKRYNKTVLVILLLLLVNEQEKHTSLSLSSSERTMMPFSWWSSSSSFSSSLFTCINRTF